jgi:hypothetical protein
MKLIRACTFLIPLLIVGCATPPEVKQLSLKQMEYFDSAIEAVSIQSEALIIATEIIVNNAKYEIEKKETEGRKGMEDLAINEIPKLPNEKKKAAAKRMLDAVTEMVKVSEQSRANLDNDLEIIKKKSIELTLYLRKMKDVHMAIDAYVQSEKAGEKVVADILQHPSVNDLLSKANDLVPKIDKGSTQLQAILNGT